MKNKVAYAASVQERGSSLSLYYDEDTMDDNLSKWLSRKSLCTEELFDLSLQEQKISRKSFNLAIKPLNEHDIEILTNDSKEMMWYKKAIEIVDKDYSAIINPDIIDFSFAIRSFVYYFKSEIEQISLKEFTISDLDAFIIHLTEEFMQLSAKTLVYDLHEQKKKAAFKGDTSNERFVYYMHQRFGSKAALLEFYEDYPVLFRLLTERVLFHIDNYKEFVQSIQQSLPEFLKVFSLTAPYLISEIVVGAGDSHGKGKTVILFNMNDRRFAFKYKNLEIGQRFNEFLSYLEEETGKQFFKIKRIIHKNYCIEEFVSRKECNTEEEVKRFYNRFGEYVALAYLLCGNDFHYENLIAHGEYPVLIDIETLIQNDNPIKQTMDNPYVALAIKKFSSVLGAALLPMKFHEKRLEPLAEDNIKVQKALNLSAFDGSKQKSPYKVFSLINPNSDDVRFEYVEYELEGANNIPMFSGKEVSGSQYKSDVVNGFEEICEYFRTHANEVVSRIYSIFSDVIVRNVIKNTQKYADMLGYGCHPKCMKDYIEREKLFENLWAFEYKNKSAVLPEIRDLLVNDVPIFYNNTSSRALITSDGTLLNDYYERNALDRVKERVLNFDEKEYTYQKLRLELSIGTFKLQTETIDLGRSAEEVLHRIKDIICNRAIYDKSKKYVTFEDFLYELDGTLDHGALNAELYDGLGGIYLFLLYYSKKHSDSKVEELKLVLEKSLFHLPKKQEKNVRISAYIGKYAVLYPLYHKYKLEKNNEDLIFVESLLAGFDNEINQTLDVDWLNGVSGLIQILINYYRLTGRFHFLEKAEKLSGLLDKKKISLCGFAHGYSGIIYTYCSLYSETGKPYYAERVNDFIKQENQHFNGKIWPDLRKGKHVTSQWCHGTVGIGLTRLHLLKSGFDSEQIQKDFYYCIDDILSTKVKESGICHGNIGRYIFLSEVQNAQLCSKELYEQINNCQSEILQCIFEDGANIDSFKGQCVLGLMTGITGIGYGLLRAMDVSIPNILCLE